MRINGLAVRPFIGYPLIRSHFTGSLFLLGFLSVNGLFLIDLTSPLSNQNELQVLHPSSTSVRIDFSFDSDSDAATIINPISRPATPPPVANPLATLPGTPLEGISYLTLILSI